MHEKSLANNNSAMLNIGLITATPTTTSTATTNAAAEGSLVAAAVAILAPISSSSSSLNERGATVAADTIAAAAQTTQIVLSTTTTINNNNNNNNSSRNGIHNHQNGNRQQQHQHQVIHQQQHHQQQQQQQQQQQSHQQNIHHLNGGGGSNNNGAASSTTSNVLVVQQQTSGGATILSIHNGNANNNNINNNNNNNVSHCNVITTTSSQQHQQSQQQHQLQQMCSGGGGGGGGMSIVLVEQSVATTSHNGDRSTSNGTTTTQIIESNSGGGGNGTNGDSAMHILSAADQSYSSGDSLEIDIKDGAFDDVSESGYPDNSTPQTQQGYIPLLPPVGAVINPCDQTDLKDCIEELCPVCGDKVSGYHYGLLTCESCKGFFKRTVQNKKVYTCVAERQCHIDKTQRKRCPFCRFQKCLEVGMKLEAVRADRMRGGRNKFGPMYKRDRARKLQIMRQRQLALQTLRAADGGNPSQLSPTGYQQSYSHMNIKQEIQIPQISSLTSSSPDSSPSPIAIALGQVSASGATTALTLGSSGTGAGGTGSSTSGTGGGGGGSSSSNGSTNIPSTTSTAAVQNTVTDSKLWFANSTTASPHSLSPKQFSFDTGTNPTSTADSGTLEPLSLNFPRVSPMIREFVQSVDDREWQQQLFSLLQSQSYNQCEVDLFELMCKVLDQNLFSQVDWARNTVFFKDLKVDDQMKLLQNSWSDMLVLDHLHQRIHNNLPDETTLHNGQKFDLLGLGLLGVPQLSDHFNELQNKLQELKFDVGDYICMKFLLLLNPDFADARGITNKKTVLEGYENVQAALLDYTLTCYPSVTEKFSKLISIIPEIHAMAARGEEHLYLKHCAGSAPTQTLLMEMLHAKRK